MVMTRIYKNEDYRYEKLYTFRDKEDEEVQKGQEIILRNVSHNKYILDELIRIYDHLFWMDSVGLYLSETNYKPIMRKSILNFYKCQTIIDMELWDEIRNYREDLESSNEKLNFVSELLELEKQLMTIEKDSEEENLYTLLVRLLKGEMEEVYSLENTVELSEIFKFLDSELIAKYIVVPKTKANILWKYLRYQNENHDFTRCEGIIEEKINEIEKQKEIKEKELGKLDIYKINELLKIMDTIKV